MDVPARRPALHRPLPRLGVLSVNSLVTWRRFTLSLGALLAAIGSTIGEARAEKQLKQLELRDHDRVVLIGNTLIERDQRYGYLETALTERFSDRNITFRNLGWS